MTNIPETSSSLLRALGEHPDSHRWGEFIARYEPIMRAFLRTHFPRVEADDVLQESFLALMRALPSYVYNPQEYGRFHNYLTGIVRNRALRFRRKQDQQASLIEHYQEEATLAQETKHSLQEDILELALQQLLADETIAAQTRQIFIRVAINGEAPAEVAERFSLTRNNVDQIKNRLTKRLRELAQSLEDLL